MPTDPRRVKSLFNAAVDLPHPADRPAFVDRECEGEPELRRRLEELLAAFDHPAAALEAPLAAAPEAGTDLGETILATLPSCDRPEPDLTAATTQTLTPMSRPPDDDLPLGEIVAGRYKPRQSIGEGGMGRVYLAEQVRPVRRQVALKVIKAGMDTRAILARFESERQALALMDHPNIAKVLDAGSTEGGRPFFVMELVKGVPLTEYCDQHRLGLPERLELFRQICSAIQHAHQKGIIHRDLKPSNILVENHDERAVPKVIDFGLAKAASGLRLSDNSLYSAFGTVAGTPLYMAPEQAMFNAIDVDTRADVYALGVILYELLTGSTPIRRETFQRAALDEMLRNIREVEPPTPSNRISSSEGLPSIAASRHCEPARLTRLVRGDLDWIVMKALAKERHQRYDSPIALAQDLERLTNHEPVTAGPPTVAYRFRKFVRRNRGRVIAASLILLALVVGVVGTTLGLIEADRHRKGAEKRLAQKDKANEILLSIFRDLNPGGREQEALPLSDRLGRRLDAATSELEGEATDDPLGVARMQTALGESLFGLGHADKAIALALKARATFERLLGSEHPDTLMAMNNLGSAYVAAGEPDKALPLLEKALSLRKDKLGADHPDTIASISNLAECCRAAGKLDRALPLYEEALRLAKARNGADHADTLALMHNLAVGLEAAGKLDRAIPLLHETLSLRRAKLGPDHLETLGNLGNLARAYTVDARLDRALPLLEEAVRLSKAKLGSNHPNTLNAMGNLAEGYRSANRLDLSLPLSEETTALLRSKHGADHPDTLTSLNNLALGYIASGKPDRAVPILEETLTLQKPKLGADHPLTLSTMGNLAVAYRLTGKLDRSIPLIEETVKLRIAASGSDHPETWVARAVQGLNYAEVGRIDEAIPLLEGAHRERRRHATLRTTAPYLLEIYLRTGRADRAATLAREMLAEGLPSVPAGSPGRAALIGTAALGLIAGAAWDEVEPLLRECLAIREKLEPDAWTTFNTRSMLGGVLLGRKRHAEAEPLLKSGYDGMKRRSDAIPPRAKPRLGEALDRLIALAEATGKADELKEWRAERAKLPEASPTTPTKPASEGR